MDMGPVHSISRTKLLLMLSAAGFAGFTVAFSILLLWRKHDGLEDDDADGAIESEVNSESDQTVIEQIKEHPPRSNNVPNQLINGCKNHSSATLNRTLSESSFGDSTIIGPVANESGEGLTNEGIIRLHKAVTVWRQAIEVLSRQTNPEAFDVKNRLSAIINRTESLIQQCEQIFLSRDVNNMVIDAAISALQEADPQYNFDFEDDIQSIVSDTCSFYSATDLAEVSHLDKYEQVFAKMPFYTDAIKVLQTSSIGCRALRTTAVGCLSDAEFLAKLHCLRQAFSIVFSDPQNVEFMRNSGKKLVLQLLDAADKETQLFEQAYDELVDYSMNPDNWDAIADELASRQVVQLGFFDVVLDFILIDSFEDLESPPSSLKSVLGNQWVSEGFKVRALSMAVWSVLKAKRTIMKVPDGFINRYYDVTEIVSPTLAWGFFGPPGMVQNLCYKFKELVVEFLHQIFSFRHCDFSSKEALAKSVLECIKTFETTMQAVFDNPPENVIIDSSTPLGNGQPARPGMSMSVSKSEYSHIGSINRTNGTSPGSSLSRKSSKSESRIHVGQGDTSAS